MGDEAINGSCEEQQDEEFFDALDGSLEDIGMGEGRQEELGAIPIIIESQPSPDQERSKAAKRMENSFIEETTGLHPSSKEQLHEQSPSSDIDGMVVETHVDQEETVPRLSRYHSSASGMHPLADLVLQDPVHDDSTSDSNLFSDHGESISCDNSRSSAEVGSIALSQAAEGKELTSNRRYKKVKVKAKKKTKTEFASLSLIQELRSTAMNVAGLDSPIENGAIYSLKFSLDGNFLAAAGEDGILRIWQLVVDEVMALMGEDSTYKAPRIAAIFQQEPVQEMQGHEGAILDLCWSRNQFILTASMDRTVRLWHYSRRDCLGVFHHPDFVTSVAFHPRDDRLFITGSLDCRLRLWSIADRTVKAWNELPVNNFVTAVSFTSSGKFVLAGTSTGVCLLFESEGFSYSTQIHVHSRRGKNKIGKKICGIEPMPGKSGDEKILISTNDSRVRMYTLRDKSILSKCKGHLNESSQIKASFSDDGEYIISGSEDNRVYIWSVENRFRTRSFFSRRASHHINSCELFEAHSKPVTCAIFAPSSVRNRLQSVGLRPIVSGDSFAEAQIIVAADLNGQIKVYENNSLLEIWLNSEKYR